MQILDTPLLLASQSPRRRQLLTEAGFTRFRIIPADIDESFPEEMPLYLAAEYVAANKAKAILQQALPNEVILSADSMVILDGVHYAKPENEAHAIEMITALAGTTHLVITGCCLMSQSRTELFSAHTEVTLKPMSQAEIVYYVQQYRPYDKAGAYGAQEWIGLCKISKYVGSYTNVLGLPVDLVYDKLQIFVPNGL
jgi:septum formation protein